MADPIKHVLVDSSVMAVYTLPKSHSSQRLKDISQQLFDAIANRYWPTVKLYSPTICIAETQAVLDRYHLCDWQGPGKNPQKRINKSEYRKAISRLNQLIETRAIDRIELDQDHILAASLVSPINAKYQIRRKSHNKKSKQQQQRRQQIKPPMGAADCLIIGISIMLAHRLEHGSVTLITADRRMTDVVKKARSLTKDQAEKLGLLETALKMGLTWNENIYPACINLVCAEQKDLITAFQAWPLPKRQSVAKDIASLTGRQIDILKDIYFGFKGKTGHGVDSLPYSEMVDAIRSQYVSKAGVYLSNKQIYKTLSSWRKANKLKKPDTFF